MNLFDTISGDIKAAMLARDKVRLETLRGVKKEFLEAKTAKGGDGELSDDAAMKILVKMHKQRKESAAIFSQQNRQDLAENELAEAAPEELAEDARFVKGEACAARAYAYLQLARHFGPQVQPRQHR